MAANEEWCGECSFGKRSAYNRAAVLPLQSALPYASTMSVISAVVYWYMSNVANNLTALEDNKTYFIQNEGIAHAQNVITVTSIAKGLHTYSGDWNDLQPIMTPVL